MALLKLDGAQTTAISRPSEGMEVDLRALRDGSMINSDWLQAAVFAGYGYHVIDGSLVSGATGGGEGTTITIDQPDLLISIPNGTCMIPLRVSVAVHPGAYANEDDEVDILVAVDQDKAYDASGTADTLTSYNMNTLCGYTSVATVIGGTSAAITAPVNDLELARFATTADTNGTAANFTINPCNLLYEPETPPILNGPCCLTVYWGGTVATTGFVQAEWLELPESAFKL